MVRQPKDLAEAKEIFREEKTKVTSSISIIAGSRWLMAILAALSLAFGAHLLYAPGRLPPLAAPSLAQIGLPEGVDFGAVGEQAQQAAEAAQRQDVGAEVQALAAEHEAQNPYVNLIGFAVATVLLLINMAIMTSRRRYTRG